MLADMRGQFFGMLAYAGFTERSAERSTAVGGSAAARDGADDPRAPHNRHAGRPAVVRAERRSQHAERHVDTLVVVARANMRQSFILSAGSTIIRSAVIFATDSSFGHAPARHQMLRRR